jgi:hypothetical protein
MLRIMIQKDLSENQETMIYLEKLLIEMSKEDDGIISELNKKEIEEMQLNNDCDLDEKTHSEK